MIPGTGMTRSEAREYDRRAIAAGVAGTTLMEAAARGVVEVLCSTGVRGPVAVVCGKGNNGGDGFVVARLLYERDIAVHVEMLVAPEELTGDALWAFESTAHIPIERYRWDEAAPARLERCEWIIDAMLGTGTSGAIREPFVTAIDAVNRARARVLAIDLPSGLDCDTGAPLGPVIVAERTVTFVAPKIGFFNPAARRYLGVVDVVPLPGGPWIPSSGDHAK